MYSLIEIGLCPLVGEIINLTLKFGVCLICGLRAIVEVHLTFVLLFQIQITSYRLSTSFRAIHQN